MTVPHKSGLELEPDLRPIDFEAVFHSQYARIARLIACITRDAGRAEELAVDVFLKWSASGVTDSSRVYGWLHRTAVRSGLDELRRRTRRERFERAFQILWHPRTPEDIYLTLDQQSRVAHAAAAMSRRDAELLLLRADGMTYEELAATLALKPASIGALLSRARKAFRKEYIKRYGRTE